MSTISDALFSLSGATSGIDWGTMADTIIENDSKPITQWEEKQEKLELKISLYEEFSALFKTMQSSLTSLKLTSTYSAKATEFTPLDGASSNVGIVTATATADAAIAQYEIEVVQKAQAHRIASDRVDDASTALGLSGTFSVDVGTLGSVDVTVEASDSLASISSKINEAAAAWGSENETTALVSASLVDRRIVLTSGLTGADSAMTLTDGDGILASLGFLDSGSVKNELNVAQDAILKLDGLTVTRETNEITDLIDNVTLNVVGTGKVQMDITLDAQTAVEGLQAFTDSYNELMEWINIRLSEETVEDPESDFERAWGLLHGDSTLWQAKSTLRNLITTPSTSPSPAARAIRSTASSAPSPPATARPSSKRTPSSSSTTTASRRRSTSASPTRGTRWRPRSTAPSTTRRANPWSSRPPSPTASSPSRGTRASPSPIPTTSWPRRASGPTPRSARSASRRKQRITARAASWSSPPTTSWRP
ncbi:flagellar filament capping protein FliD [Aminithiophilus ramosus]|uniref:Flagellar hook-associated protein 2 n=1 Tax=Aminithiophilus ramosus TaxID=3029084 RepID=A0A9Q7A9R6_9BACT|nr:flagellar filament capping protein FliD [Aminithiophilus ramosus]